MSEVLSNNQQQRIVAFEIKYLRRLEDLVESRIRSHTVRKEFEVESILGKIRT